MAEPLLKREGNIRFVSVISRGWPVDPLASATRVRTALAAQGISPYGAATVLLATTPEDSQAAEWDCQTGLCATGMPRPADLASGERLVVEDFRDLIALSVPHQGPVKDLLRTWRRLADHGRSLGYRLRPYWRVALRRRQLADGNLLPVADVAVFLERA